MLSEKGYTRYQATVDKLGYSCHSYYEVSHFKEEEINGAGERIPGTAPNHTSSCFVEASFKPEEEIGIKKEVG